MDDNDSFVPKPDSYWRISNAVERWIAETPSAAVAQWNGVLAAFRGKKNDPATALPADMNAEVARLLHLIANECRGQEAEYMQLMTGLANGEFGNQLINLTHPLALHITTKDAPEFESLRRILIMTAILQCCAAALDAAASQQEALAWKYLYIAQGRTNEMAAPQPAGARLADKRHKKTRAERAQLEAVLRQYEDLYNTSVSPETLANTIRMVAAEKGVSRSHRYVADMIRAFRNRPR